MAFIKGNSGSSTQATEVLADIESLCLANGWTKLGVWNEPGGTFDWHFYESSGLSNGDRDFSVGIRTQTNGAGHLVFITAEEVDVLTGTVRIHAPSNWTGNYKVKRPSDGGVFEAVHSSDYATELATPIWHSVVGYNDSWVSGHIPPFGQQCNIEDAALVQWMLKVEPDGIVISTFRTQASNYGGAYVLLGTSLLPFAPNPIFIGPFSTNLVNQGMTTRMPINPDFLPYMDPDPANNTSYDVNYGHWLQATYGPASTIVISGTVGASLLADGLNPFSVGPSGSAMFVYARSRNKRIFDPDTGDYLGIDSTFQYALWGWVPYIVQYNSDAAIDIGDEVQGPGNTRYVHAGHGGALWIEK